MRVILDQVRMTRSFPAFGFDYIISASVPTVSRRLCADLRHVRSMNPAPGFLESRHEPLEVDSTEQDVELIHMSVEHLLQAESDVSMTHTSVFRVEAQSQQTLAGEVFPLVQLFLVPVEAELGDVEGQDARLPVVLEAELLMEVRNVKQEVRPCGPLS